MLLLQLLPLLLLAAAIATHVLAVRDSMPFESAMRKHNSAHRKFRNNNGNVVLHCSGRRLAG